MPTLQQHPEMVCILTANGLDKLPRNSFILKALLDTRVRKRDGVAV